MPLPAFARLAPERRERILAVALRHFARDGVDRASFNAILAESEVAKSSAYQYFDGRDDLLAAVRRDVMGRAGEALGSWAPAADPAGFWTQLDATARRLRGHAAAHPDDAALLAQRPPGSDVVDGWLDALLADAHRLRLIAPGLDRELVRATTAAVMGAVDAWALDRLAAGRPTRGLGGAWRMLAGLWGAPALPESARAGGSGGSGATASIATASIGTPAKKGATR